LTYKSVSVLIGFAIHGFLHGWLAAGLGLGFGFSQVLLGSMGVGLAYACKESRLPS